MNKLVYRVIGKINDFNLILTTIVKYCDSIIIYHYKAGSHTDTIHIYIDRI